jgi:hypothetical protein
MHPVSLCEALNSGVFFFSTFLNKPPTHKSLRILSDLYTVLLLLLPRPTTTMELRNDLDSTDEQQVRAAFSPL